MDFNTGKPSILSQGEPFRRPLPPDQGAHYRRLMVYGGLILAALVVLAGVFAWYGNRTRKTAATGPVATSAPAISPATLPPDLGMIGDGYGNGSSTQALKAEQVTFGTYYKPYAAALPGRPPAPALPLSVKTDGRNYFDLSRKLDLEPAIGGINRDGFAVIPAPNKTEGADFFTAYRSLLAKEIPIIVTSDFLWYYSQNIVKQVYKEIERSAFYDNLWYIYKELYNIALTRYQQRREEVGVANDPYLEAARLETTYFGVALQLLSPLPEQINRVDNLTDSTKFAAQEVGLYDFKPPDDLKAEIEAEAALIRAAAVTARSPVFRYDRDYRGFVLPANYQKSAKLTNFYRTIEWLNSNFPLYYRGADCPECLLDYDDWLIAQGAAGLMTTDLASVQDLKNRWAIIYKFNAFFRGLRSEISYLHYQRALIDTFGADYDLAAVFSRDNASLQDDLTRLQAKLAAVRFLPIEGTLDRNDLALRPQLGLRLLQDLYWPNQYLLQSLTGRELSFTLDGRFHLPTLCSDKNLGPYRCAGIGLDVINLISPITGDRSYDENSGYDGFGRRVDGLRTQLGAFDVNAWNSNHYWLTLDLARSLFTAANDTPVPLPSVARARRSVLGAWTNLHLEADEWENYADQTERAELGVFHECSAMNYVEPAPRFVAELVAKHRMLTDIILALNVADKTNAAPNMLKELNKELEHVLAIMGKQAKGEAMSDDDCKFVTSLITNYALTRPADPVFKLSFGRRNISERLDGVGYLVYVYPKGKELVITVGPVFNQVEDY